MFAISLILGYFIIVPAKITAYNQSVVMMEESEGIATVYRVYCNATGYPQPSFYFYKGTSANPDRRLGNSPDNRFFIETSSKEGYAAMVFRRVRIEDGGDYLCEAYNGDYDPDRKLMNARIIVPPRFDRVWNITVRESMTAQVICDVNIWTTQPMTLSWRKNNGSELIIPEGQTGRFKAWFQNFTEQYQFSRFYLEIANTQPEDLGNWTCDARNEGGNRSHNTSVYVNFIPRFPPDIQVYKLYGYPQLFINLTCYIKAYPEPFGSVWMHNGQMITGHNATYKTFYERYTGPDVHQMLTNFTLKLLVNIPAGGYAEDNWIYGEYKCQISNEAGVSTHAIYLNKAERPSTPTITLKRATATTAVIEAMAQHFQEGVPITYYEVIYRGATGTVDRPMMFGADEPIILRGLKANTQYRLEVRAVNAAGTGEPNFLDFSTSRVCKFLTNW